MTYYYRKQNKDNFEEDIKDLNNKIYTIYTSLQKILLKKEIIYCKYLILE